MFAPHGFHRVGRIFSGKGKRGEWGRWGDKNRKTGNMQCISTRLKGFCFANNVYFPCVGVKRIERVHAGIRLRLGTVFQFKQKPRWYSYIQPWLTLGPFSVVYWWLIKCPHPCHYGISLIQCKWHHNTNSHSILLNQYMFQTAQDFLQKIIQCLTKPSFSHKMNGWTAQPSHQASVGKGAVVVFVEKTSSSTGSICSKCIFISFCIFSIGRESWWYLWNKYWVVFLVYDFFVLLVFGGSRVGICGTNIE